MSIRITEPIEAPENLSKEARDLWARIVREYSIEDVGGLLILKTALEAYDRMREAQEIIKNEGMQVLDRFKQQKPHSLLVAERDARSQMLLALKMLNLDLEPVRDKQGRPGGSNAY